jgi:AbrB family looped-hinge helix DNA binding protein
MRLIKLMVDIRGNAARIVIACRKEISSMKSVSVKVSKRGYIVLPASLRKEMEIKTGMRMLISKSDNKIILQPVPSFTDKLAGVTAMSFGQSAEEVQEGLDKGREDR